MRPITEVMNDLSSAVNDIQAKQKKLDDLSVAQSEAFKAVDEAQKKAFVLRGEMEEYLNLLVPGSQQNRVRQS